MKLGCIYRFVLTRNISARLLATNCVIVTLLGLSGASRQAQARDRDVTVSGECTRQVTPDRGMITVTADIRDSDLKSAAKKATEAYERVREGVKRLGLENLEMRTSEYNLAEVREWEKDRQVSKGFQARMGLRVSTSQAQRLGEVIALAAREGLREVGQLQPYLSEEKQQKERLECLKAAAENARAKAERLAGTLGAKVGEALQVQEISSGDMPRPQPMRMEVMAKSARAMEPPSVEVGQQDLSVSVQVKFALY